MDNFNFQSSNFNNFPTDFNSPEDSLDNSVLINNIGNTSEGTRSRKNSFNNNNDLKPKTKRTRATGEALAILKKEFEVNPSPNAQNRKRISELVGLPEKNVRIWFQNRRAKFRKYDKGPGQNLHREIVSDITGVTGSNTSAAEYDRIPLNINNHYYFIDVSSLTVGSWKRLKSGNLHRDSLPNIQNLSNLSPTSINAIMSNATDLMVLISKKNFEINYFFSAIANNTKILFRIFFPINSVMNCSLSLQKDMIEKEPGLTDENDDVQETASDSDDLNRYSEIKLTITRSPKFAVYFSDMIEEMSTNQWLICEDFSEGRQVSDAFIGGSNVSHVLSGLENSLKFMNSLILDYNNTNQQIPQQLVLHQYQQPNIFQNYPQNEQHDIGHLNHSLAPSFISPQSEHSTTVFTNETASVSNFLSSNLDDSHIPKIPDFLNNSNDLHTDDQNGLNNLLSFNDQSNINSSGKFF